MPLSAQGFLSHAFFHVRVTEHRSRLIPQWIRRQRYAGMRRNMTAGILRRVADDEQFRPAIGQLRGVAGMNISGDLSRAQGMGR